MLVNRPTRLSSVSRYSRIAATVVALGSAILPRIFVASPAWADTPKFDPSTTTVAILPVIDRTGEKVEERRQRQEWTGYYNAAELFWERGFKISDPDAVDKAIKDQDLDLQDEESYRRDNFYKVAGAVNADLVIFVEITHTSEDRKSSGLFSRNDEIQGKAEVKVWLLDAKDHTSILSAVSKEGKAAGKGGQLFDTNMGTRRRSNAVGNAVKEEFEDWLNGYTKLNSKGLSTWPDISKAQALYNNHQKDDDKGDDKKSDKDDKKEG